MTVPATFIQWKGTDACIDVGCTCGWSGHIDGLFAYAYRCPACSAVWELGTQVTCTRNDSWEGVIVDPDW